MAAVLTLHQTTIGKKVIMAVTGIVLVAYVFVHMIGNLKLYQGPDALNNYADFLRVIAYPALAREQALWMVRAILLVSVVLHIWAAYSLTRLDWASRPVGYANKRLVQASYASRTMRWGGVIIGLFIIYHILHLTTGTIQPVAYTKDVYRNVVGGFQVWYVSLIYIVANVALAFHLYHGVWSMFQTLGLNDAGRTRMWAGLATIVAVAVAVGNISLPLAVMAGLVR